MKPLTSHDRPRQHARAHEPAEPTLLPFQEFAEDHTADGGEFLDDSLRMHEQTLSSVDEEDEE